MTSSPSKQNGAGGIVMRRSAGGDGDRGRRVAALVGVDEPLQQLPLLGARLRGRPLEAVRRQVLLHRRPRSLQRAVGRGDAGVEDRRRLGRRLPEHVAQDQRRPLPRRQDLHRGQERQLDRLPGDDRGVRLLVGRPRSRRADGRGTAAATGPRRTSASPAPVVFGCGSCPGRRWWRRGTATPAASSPSSVLAVTPRPQERLLDGVLRLVERRQHPVAVDVELAPVTPKQSPRTRCCPPGRPIRVIGSDRRARPLAAPRCCRRDR